MAKIKAKKLIKFKKTAIEPEITDESALDKALDNALDEAKKELEVEVADELDKEIQAVEEKMEVLGKVKSPVFQKSSFIKTKAHNSPVCLYELPEDIRTYLTNMWWWSNVYEKWEEWLVRHWADMDMIEKLKKFISEHYL